MALQVVAPPSMESTITVSMENITTLYMESTRGRVVVAEMEVVTLTEARIRVLDGMVHTRELILGIKRTIQDTDIGVVVVVPLLVAPVALIVAVVMQEVVTEGVMKKSMATVGVPLRQPPQQLRRQPQGASLNMRNGDKDNRPSEEERAGLSTRNGDQDKKPSVEEGASGSMNNGDPVKKAAVGEGAGLSIKSGDPGKKSAVEEGVSLSTKNGDPVKKPAVEEGAGLSIKNGDPDKKSAVEEARAAVEDPAQVLAPLRQ